MSADELLAAEFGVKPQGAPAKSHVRPLLIMLSITAIIVSVTSVLWLSDRAVGRDADRKIVQELQRMDEREALEAQWLESAIRERRVILGMTAREVLMVRGHPSFVMKGVTLPDGFREMGGKTRWGNSIRNGGH